MDRGGVVTRSQRTWSDEEYGLLSDDSASNRELSEMLGRSIGSVAAKRRALRSGWAPVRPEPWSEDEDDLIRKTWHLTAREVATRLGRGYHAVTTRRSFLGQREGVTAYGGHKKAHTVGRRSLLAKTCPQCGLLLAAHWFGLDNRKLWRVACVRCQPKRERDTRTPTRSQKDAARAFAKKLQAASLPGAERAREPWLDSDHEVLRDPDLTVIEKAIRLGRTYYGTARVCATSGYHSKVGKGDPVRGQWVIDNPNTPTQAA